MNKQRTVLPVLFLTFFLACILIWYTFRSAKEEREEDRQFMKEHSLFETVELCGNSALRADRYSSGRSSEKGIDPKGVSQRIRLLKKGEGRWDVYVPADLTEKAYVQFSHFDRLELELQLSKEGEKGSDAEKKSAGEGTAGEASVETAAAGKASAGEAAAGEAAAGTAAAGKASAGEAAAGTASAGEAAAGTAAAGEKNNTRAENTSSGVKAAEEKTSGRLFFSWKDSDLLYPERMAGSSAVFHARALGKDGQVLEEAEITFYTACDVPTLYLATETGSMDAVNADKSVRERARCLFYTQDGEKDASVGCKIHGRGNSSWKAEKKQYSLNLSSKASVLGMDPSEKFALIANHSDSSNLRNKAAFDVAALCGMPSTPQSVFVNVYFNGMYNGLYLAAQRPNARGGSVRIADLEGANASIDSGGEGIVDQVDENGLEIHASAREEVPGNITGGYLLEMDGRYKDEDYWFSTRRHHFVIKYPEAVPLPEAQYIAEYLRSAESSFYSEEKESAGSSEDAPKNREKDLKSEDGETASASEVLTWENYLDRDSWVFMYLLQDTFAQWDVESFSFFVYKDADDPLLYCGPAWDFDLSAGHTGLGRLPNVMLRSMWLRDHREGWLTQLSAQPSFAQALETAASKTFLPLLNAYLGEWNEYQDENEGEPNSAEGNDSRSDDGGDRDAAAAEGPVPADALSGWIDGALGSKVRSFPLQMEALRTSAAMDCRRWDEKDEYLKSAIDLRSWLRDRSSFLKDYAENPEEYCVVTLRYGFADMDIYVRRGEPIGFVPVEKYGEHLYGSFRRRYGEISGWKCEDGSVLTEDTVIDRDQILLPVSDQE